MNRYDQTKKASIKEFILLLNKLKYTVVDINGEFYVINEFETQDPSSSIFEHTLYGRDVTTLVENSIDNLSVDTYRQRVVITNISNLPEVR